MSKDLSDSAGYPLLEIPADAKFYDVDNVAVAKLSDGSYWAYSPEPRKLFNGAKVFAYGMPITRDEFIALATE